jgi:hypothetical protein
MIRWMRQGSAALALATALLVATAIPAQAGGLGPGAAGSAGWDGLWRWLAALRLPGLDRPVPGPREVTVKQGSGIDPNGSPNTQSSETTGGEQGSGIDPNG